MPRGRRDFPHMRLFVREDLGETRLRQFSERVNDALLLPDKPAAPSLVSRRRITGPLHVMLPAGQPLVRNERGRPGDLAGETVLTPSQHLRRRITRFCEENGALHARDHEGTTPDTLRRMVTAEMGGSLLHALCIRFGVMRGQLVTARALADGAPHWPIA